jgi:solute carrier family 35, member C2
MFSGDHLDFHFPLFTTSLHMVVQFFLTCIVLLIFPALRPSTPPATSLNPNPKPLVSLSFYLTRLVPTGTTTSLDIGLGNTSLRYITLTFYTMCKSSVLIFVLTFAFLFRLEAPSIKLIAIILTMTLGVLLMVYGETAFHALGFALAMSASFFSGFRWALTQILLLRHPATSNPFATLFFLSPIMFVTLFTISMFAEQPSAIITGIHLLVSKEGTGRALILLFIPGSLAFCMIAAEFTLLQRTSVVTLSICGIFKEVVTISAAGIVFHDELSAVNVSGLLVTIACIACYNYLKVTKMREDARMKIGKRDDDGGRILPQQQQVDQHARSGAGSGSGDGEDDDADASRPLISNQDIQDSARGGQIDRTLTCDVSDGVGLPGSSSQHRD